MPECDAVVRAHDVSVRQRGTRQDYAASDDGSRLTQECSTIDLRRFTHVWLRYTKRLVMLSGMCVTSQGMARSEAGPVSSSDRSAPKAASAVAHRSHQRWHWRLPEPALQPQETLLVRDGVVRRWPSLQSL